MWLIARAGQGLWQSVITGDPLAQRRIADAMGLFVWRPLVTLLPLSALVGLIAAIAASRALNLYHAELLIVGALVKALAKDIVPLVVGVFASGSIAVELASRLGAMSLNNEIDALEALGHDPARFAMGPSLIAVVSSAPVHMVCAAAVALTVAALPLQGMANLAWASYFQLAFTDEVARALLTGIAKVIVFALIAFAVGASVGARAVRTPGEIGRHATLAFTAGLLGIFAAAALWAALA